MFVSVVLRNTLIFSHFLQRNKNYLNSRLQVIRMIELDFMTLVLALVVVFIFYIASSWIIREVMEFIFRTHQNTFHQSSQIAAVLTLFIILQFFISQVAFLSGIVLGIMIIVFLLMLKRIYELSLGKAILAAVVCLIAFAVFFMLISYLLILFQGI